MSDDNRTRIVLKKYVLPVIYWKGVLAGRRWPWLMPEPHLKEA